MAKRPGKKLRIVAATLAGLLIAAVIVVPRLLDPDRYHARVVEELERMLGGDVALGDINWGVSTGLWVKVDSLVVRNATSIPIDLELTSLSVRISIRPLFSKRIEVAGLHVKHPVLTVRLSPPASTTKEAAPPDTSGNDSPPAFGVRVDKILVVDGRITVVDSLTRAGPPAIHVFGGLRLDVRNLEPGARTAFRLEFEDTRENGMGIFDCSGSFTGLVEGPRIEAPAVEASVAIRHFHSDVIKPYLEGSPVADRLDGDISIDVDFEAGAEHPASARGTIDLSGLSYTDLAVWDNPIPGGEASVRFNAGISTGVLTLDTLELSVGELSIQARASIGKTDGKTFISGTSLDGRFPLSNAARLMPWKLLHQDAKVLRDILESGGALDITGLTKTEFLTSDIASDPISLFDGLDATIRLEDLAMRPSTRLPKIESISGLLEIHDDNVSAKDIKARWRGLRLPAMDISISRLTARPMFEASVKGPLTIPESTDPETRKLLNEHGLASFSGSADLDMRLAYDLARPDRWTADIRVDFNGIDATSYPDHYELENFRGRFTLKRDKSIEFKAQNVSGILESTSFAVDGGLTSGGPSGLVVDARAKSQGLKLRQLAVFFPALRPYGLDGSIEMDVNMHYPHSNPAALQLDGTIGARSFSIDFPSIELAIKNSSADVRFDGRAIHVAVDADSGKYKNEPFDDLRLTADYKNRVVSRWEIEGGIGGGTLTAAGSVDITKPRRIGFDVTTEIDSVALASIGNVAGIDTMTITGPVSAEGYLTGRTGASTEFVASLAGSLDAASGPGEILMSSPTGQVFYKLLTAIKLKGLLQGDLTGGGEDDWLGFDHIRIGAAIDSGKVTFAPLTAHTPAVTIDGGGTYDVLQRQLDLSLDLAVFATANDILGLMPIVGETASDLASFNALIQGPLDEPDISISALGGVTRGISNALKDAGRSIKGIFK